MIVLEWLCKFLWFELIEIKGGIIFNRHIARGKKGTCVYLWLGDSPFFPQILKIKIVDKAEFSFEWKIKYKRMMNKYNSKTCYGFLISCEIVCKILCFE